MLVFLTDVPFPCMLDIVPIKNEKGQVVLLLVSHKDLTFERQKAGKFPSNIWHFCFINPIRTCWHSWNARREFAALRPYLNNFTPNFAIAASKISAILDATSQSLHRKRQFGGIVPRSRGLSALGPSRGFLSVGLATTVAAAALVGSGRSDEELAQGPSNSKALANDHKVHPVLEKLNFRRESAASLNDPRDNAKVSTSAFQRRHSMAPTSDTLHSMEAGLRKPIISSPNPSPCSKYSPKRNSSQEASSENEGQSPCHEESASSSDQRAPLLLDDSLSKASSDKGATAENEETESSSDNSDSDSSMEEPSSTYKYQRRRSRAVLYNLSGRFDHKPKRKMPLKKIQNLSGKETIPEYRVQDVQPSRFILLHYSIWKIIWDWLILACTFYIGVMVPYNAALSVIFRNEPQSVGMRIVDIVIGLLFFFDVVLNFLTTYVSKSGQVVYEPRQIALHYIRGWLVLDLIAAIPFDLIFYRTDKLATVNMLKLARLLRLLRLILKIERYTQHSAIILGLLMGMFTLISHWFACIWLLIGYQDFSNSHTKNHCWLNDLGMRILKSTSASEINLSSELMKESLYVSSLYYTTSSLTSVGFGNVSPNTINEKIFSICAMLLGGKLSASST
ncbi:Potassium voltage-gated channel subfamily H member 4 [Cichlidogyrus casuarinus]|uniref:Potassium voltage-gated channel subfamily H member 4 n=1 Tax=Cichlidogyrus casuarinus TaxID=1844966 RepID=A0ABD2QQM0_9PLAT